jgi:hypothetical protein
VPTILNRTKQDAVLMVLEEAAGFGNGFGYMVLVSANLNSIRKDIQYKNKDGLVSISVHFLTNHKTFFF